MSQHAFPMGDGTFVITDRYEPLPAAVRAIAQAEVTANVPFLAKDAAAGGERDAMDAAISNTRSELSMATGKNIVIVYLEGNSAVGCDGHKNPWSYTGRTGSLAADGCRPLHTSAAAVAEATAARANDQYAAAYEIIIREY